MDKDLALLILASCSQSTRELEELIPMMKIHGSPEDYERIKLAVGSAIYDIIANIMEYVEARCPEIRLEKERRMGKYGRAF